MTITRIMRFVEPLIGVVGVVLLWMLVARLAANATLVPPPAVVWQAFVAMLDGDLPRDILASLAHLGVGYGLGVATGLALALAAGSSRWLEAVLDPLAEFLRPISPIAWIPIAILMFGVGRLVPIYLIFYASLFPIFVSTLDGISGQGRVCRPSIRPASET